MGKEKLRIASFVVDVFKKNNFMEVIETEAQDE